MNVTTRLVDRVAFLDLEGALTVEANTERLHRELERLAAGLVDRVVLDFGRVRALDARGIGQLVLLHSKAESCKLGFELANLSPSQREMIGLVQLAGVLGVRDAAQPVDGRPKRPPRLPAERRRRGPVGRWASSPLTG